jgi:hypothetical protein
VVMEAQPGRLAAVKYGLNNDNLLLLIVLFITFICFLSGLGLLIYNYFHPHGL